MGPMPSHPDWNGTPTQVRFVFPFGRWRIWLTPIVLTGEYE